VYLHLVSRLTVLTGSPLFFRFFWALYLIKNRYKFTRTFAFNFECPEAVHE
jgi:hypothetical protein